MAVGAVIENGKIMESAAEKSVKSTASNKNGMDKDAFLQLLVAQMKYQDPLQPTSNTEYISQYATFSQVEQMQNMASTMELSRASALVGEYVNVEIQDSNGDTKTIEGKVDYVTYENGKAYVSIDGESYLADNVKAVVDQEYQSAFELTVAFIKAMNSLPAFAATPRAASATVVFRKSRLSIFGSFGVMIPSLILLHRHPYCRPVSCKSGKTADFLQTGDRSAPPP